MEMPPAPAKTQVNQMSQKAEVVSFLTAAGEEHEKPHAGKNEEQTSAYRGAAHMKLILPVGPKDSRQSEYESPGPEYARTACPKHCRPAPMGFPIHSFSYALSAHPVFKILGSMNGTHD